MQGFQITFFTEENRRHGHQPAGATRNVSRLARPAVSVHAAA